MSEINQEELSAVQHVLAIMGREGDVKTLWDPHRPDEVQTAREQFNELRSRGYEIFKVKRDGEAGERMTTFDPEAAKMIAIPKIVAG